MKRPLIRLALTPVLAAAWLTATAASPGYAQTAPPPFDRVEEDWELVIAQPDLIADGPQMTTSMSPTGDVADRFFAFNLNYRSQPSFRSGGLEVIAFNGEQVLNVVTQHSSKLAQLDETIRWTQSMSLLGGSLDYKILDGQSTTWGAFGQGSGAVLNSKVASSLGTLSAYRPEVSVAHSGTGWQSNRVGEMRLLRVRYYDGNQLVAIDETPRAIDLGH